MGICDLLTQANAVGRDCNSVEDLRDITQQLLDLLCNSGLCSTTPQELAVYEGCVDSEFDFDAEFGDCIKDQRVVFSVCPNGNSIWYPTDNGEGDIIWKPFSLRETGDSLIIQEVTIGPTAGVFTDVYSNTFVTIPGMLYDVTLGFGYLIQTYGNISGPVDTVEFTFRSTQAPHLQLNASGISTEGWKHPDLRNGHNGFFNYKFVASGTSETISLRVRANGTGTGWVWKMRGFYLNWSQH